MIYSYWPPHMAELKQDDQLEHTYSSCVRIRDVAQKTCQRRWTIGKSGERGSGISVLAARHDDDNDDDDVCYTFASLKSHNGLCGTKNTITSLQGHGSLHFSAASLLLNRWAKRKSVEKIYFKVKIMLVSNIWSGISLSNSFHFLLNDINFIFSFVCCV